MVRILEKIKKGKQILKSEGLSEMLVWGIKFAAWKLGGDYIYRKFYPNFATVSLCGRKLKFDAQDVSIFYDFRDDFKGEKIVIKDIMKNIKKDDTFFDVGANVGLYSCFVASEVDDENVYAIEPHPEMAKRIERNTKINGISVNVVEAALSDSVGQADLVLKGPTMSEISFSETDDKSITVSVRKGDDLSEDNNIPSVIKIDVEGHELSVLRGFERTLSSDKCQLVYCEKHISKVNQNEGRLPVTDFLEDFGFSCEVIHKRRTQSYIKATKIK